MNASRHFSGGIKTFYRFEVESHHLGVFIDHQSTHRVMNLRPQPRGIERRLDGRFGVFEDHASQIVILSFFRKGIPAGNLFLECVHRHAISPGEIVQGVKFLDRSVFQAPLERMRNDLLLDRVRIAHDNGGISQEKNGIRAFLAVSGFLEKTLAGFGIHHQTVTDQRFTEQRNIAETLFFRTGPGPELNPIHLNIRRAACAGGQQRFAGGPGMVG